MYKYEITEEYYIHDCLNLLIKVGVLVPVIER